VITDNQDNPDNDVLFFGLYDGHHGNSMSADLDEILHNLIFSALEVFQDSDAGVEEALRFAFSQVYLKAPRVTSERHVGNERTVWVRA
jgi:hypothetical protein